MKISVTLWVSNCPSVKDVLNKMKVHFFNTIPLFSTDMISKIKCKTKRGSRTVYIF